MRSILSLCIIIPIFSLVTVPLASSISVMLPGAGEVPMVVVPAIASLTSCDKMANLILSASDACFIFEEGMALSASCFKGCSLSTVHLWQCCLYLQVRPSPPSPPTVHQKIIPRSLYPQKQVYPQPFHHGRSVHLRYSFTFLIRIA